MSRWLEAFVVAILLLTWQSFFDLSQSAEYQVLEYYAGVGRIARLSACTGYRAAAFDVVFDKPEVTEAWPGSPTTKAKVRKLSIWQKMCDGFDNIFGLYVSWRAPSKMSLQNMGLL